jgi:hypothetical protein
MKMMLGLTAAFGILLTTGAALADDQIRYLPKTILDLAGTQIEGEVVKPDGVILVTRRISRFPSQIPQRASFAPELLTSTERL